MSTQPQDSKNLRFLAEQALEREQYAEAEALFRQVISYLELAVGDSNIEVAKTLQCLARALEEQGQHEEARTVRHRADKILCTH